MEQGLDRGLAGLQPMRVPPKRAESSAHIRLVGRTRRDDADGGKGLQLDLRLKLRGGRVVHHRVTRLDPAQGRRLAMADLHEAFGAAPAYMIRRGDGDPVAAHAAFGANTRSR